MKNCEIMTPCGKIAGGYGADQTVAAYKGIRYGRAGRFEYPTQVTEWKGTYRADTFGSCSYQPRAFYDEAKVPEKAFYYHEFREGETYTYSEDCLFLNIWAPVKAKDAPVLFYIHGGAFTGGCGHEKHFDGSAYCRKGIVVVIINYRLGPLGFACIPGCLEDGRMGNYAMYDQITALSWVRDNIGAFGGNPDKITIMGQSAGAVSVQQLCLSPMTVGMFGGAILLSGGGVSEEFFTVPTAEESSGFWNRVEERMEQEHHVTMKEAEPALLFSVFETVSRENKDGRLVCTPVIDGHFLTESALGALKAGKAHSIPYLIGSTSQDMVPPILHRMAKDWARLQYEQGRFPAYVFFFERQLPGDDSGAWHSSDLWYEFGTLKNCWRPFTKWDYELSEMMVSYFANFIKTGNPNSEAMTQWLPAKVGQNKVMRFGDRSVRMGGVSMAKLTETMMTRQAVGE